MEVTFFPYIAAFVWIGVLFMVGVLLRAKIKVFRTYMVPASLIGAILKFVKKPAW